MNDKRPSVSLIDPDLPVCTPEDFDVATWALTFLPPEHPFFAAFDQEPES